MNSESTKYNKEWSLFLDRDGVINEELQGAYVTNWNEFKFYEGSIEAIAALSNVFGKLIIVTNQRGVGRGIMHSDDLKSIHNNMQDQISINGGRIDKIYACTSIHGDDVNRKPNTGMALQAKEHFESIDFKKSVMVGNNLSDMLFGKRVSMHTVFLSTTNEPFELPHDLIDEQHNSLKEWADSLKLQEMATLN
ncbi:MAG: HAD-IIIA family hydrolase [Phycisphaerales bacterium]|nr:HAD-IIIA family hydrolase [Phycisphaerales bacterium]